MANSFNFGSFIGRWVFAVLLVFGTYNPTDFSFIGWLLEMDSFGPVIAIVGLVLVIGWVIYLRATFLSLGWLGIALGTALFSCLVWLFVDLGLFTIDAVSVFTWVVLVLLSLLLAVGMSWSHIRRRLTGQLDVDDLEDGRG